MMDSNEDAYHFDGGLQHLVIYETASRFYIVGSNSSMTRSKVLKIDRSESCELNINDDGVEYNETELADLLHSLDQGNRSKAQKSHLVPPGLHRKLYAFGIIGFVKFLHGYSIVFITKRTKVASVGYHSVYKIEGTEMISLCPEPLTSMSPEEQRYHKTFTSVDLSSNFYFSYSYDITHTLQHNLSAVSSVEFASRGEPAWRFVWNKNLVKKSELIGKDWFLPIIHGYVRQAEITVFGRSLLLAVIARRSSRFAGTRFLKRGANSSGHVANEIEVEQILHDTSFRNTRMTSFVQLRGSVPGYWSQESGMKMTPKPPIVLNRHDPFSATAAAHFGELFERYGSPIYCLNLVKKRESRKHESLLTEELTASLNFLNQFVPYEHHIRYIGFDMSKANKKGVALDHLEVIGNRLLRQVGFFCSFPDFYCHRVRCDSFYRDVQNVQPVDWETCVSSSVPKMRKQRGVVRINCVDCLDRTNTAAFVVGKCALGLQIYALGLCDTPYLGFDTDAVRMLEDMFEDVGNVVALQYGGSQLVHRVDSYRQHGWGTNSKDWMRTISRYYSNTFSDFDKQAAINLFLGVYEPSSKSSHLWDLQTDYFLHIPWMQMSLESSSDGPKPYSAWLNEAAVQCLPNALENLEQNPSHYVPFDAFSCHYKAYKLESLKDSFQFKMESTVKDYMPNPLSDPSPFVHRNRGANTALSILERRISMTPQKNVNLSSDGPADSDIDEEISDQRQSPEDIITKPSAKEVVQESIKLKSLCPSFEEYYGTRLRDPVSPDKQLYRQYVKVWKNSTRLPDDWQGTLNDRVRSPSTTFVQQSAFLLDSSYEVAPPTVKREAKEIYANYVAKKEGGIGKIGVGSYELYRKFVGMAN